MGFITLELLVVLDLFITLFFHLVQLKRFCDDEIKGSLLRLTDRIGIVEGSVTESKRISEGLYEFIFDSFEQNERDELHRLFEVKDGKGGQGELHEDKEKRDGLK